MWWQASKMWHDVTSTSLHEWSRYRKAGRHYARRMPCASVPLSAVINYVSCVLTNNHPWNSAPFSRPLLTSQFPQWFLCASYGRWMQPIGVCTMPLWKLYWMQDVQVSTASFVQDAVNANLSCHHIYVSDVVLWCLVEPQSRAPCRHCMFLFCHGCLEGHLVTN